MKITLECGCWLETGDGTKPQGTLMRMCGKGDLCKLPVCGRSSQGDWMALLASVLAWTGQCGACDHCNSSTGDLPDTFPDIEMEWQ